MSFILDIITLHKKKLQKIYRDYIALSYIHGIRSNITNKSINNIIFFICDLWYRNLNSSKLYPFQYLIIFWITLRFILFAPRYVNLIRCILSTFEDEQINLECGISCSFSISFVFIKIWKCDNTISMTKIFINRRWLADVGWSMGKNAQLLARLTSATSTEFVIAICSALIRSPFIVTVIGIYLFHVCLCVGEGMYV